MDDIATVTARIGFPCALKPLHSHVFQRHCGARIKAFIVDSAGELADRFAEMRALGVEMLATEIIPGAEDQFYGYYTYVDASGEPLFHLTKRKLRQYPVGFGTGAYHVTTWDADVAEAGEAFVRGVGVRGLANVEFKRDARDGRLKLIECNHRFTAPTELFRLAGFDLARFTYDHLRGAEPVPGKYRSGVRLWHPVEDTRAALKLRRRGELSSLRWAMSVAHRQHLPVFRLRDPQPSIRDNMRRGRRAWSARRAQLELAPPVAVVLLETVANSDDQLAA
jgi:predicted ATP-grasp superfamily ATP-dependent carboligase